MVVAPPDSFPTLKRTRLVDDVTNGLRELILTDKLKPGQLLRQIELAEQLNVSRTPLREAFRVLESDGLIRSVNGNNTVEVVDYTVEEMLQLYEVREVLDGLAAALLAKRGLSRRDEIEFERLLTTMEGARSPYDPVKYSTAHSEFHTRIVSTCGNERLQAFLPMIRMSAVLLSRRVTAAAADECCGGPSDITAILNVAREQHRAIFEAIQSGDSRAAEAAARRHIRSTMKSSLLRDASPAPTSTRTRRSASG